MFYLRQHACNVFDSVMGSKSVTGWGAGQTAVLTVWFAGGRNPNPTKILRKNSYDSGWVSISVRLGKMGFPGFLPVEGFFRDTLRTFNSYCQTATPLYN